MNMDWPDRTRLAGLGEDEVCTWYLLSVEGANADEQARIDTAASRLRRTRRGAGLPRATRW